MTTSTGPYKLIQWHGTPHANNVEYNYIHEYTHEAQNAVESLGFPQDFERGPVVQWQHWAEAWSAYHGFLAMGMTGWNIEDAQGNIVDVDPFLGDSDITSNPAWYPSNGH